MDVAGKPGKTLDMCTEIGLNVGKLVVPRPIYLNYDLQFFEQLLTKEQLKDYIKSNENMKNTLPTPTEYGRINNDNSITTVYLYNFKLTSVEAQAIYKELSYDYCICTDAHYYNGVRDYF